MVKKYNKLSKIVEVGNCTNDQLEEYSELSQKLIQIGAEKDKGFLRKMLIGLGFNREEQDTPTKNFSGGWRMRISLARALYIQPSLLLLDEPTNHLDLNATIWLTDYLSSKWKNTLIIVSHDKNFLNEVSTDIIHLSQMKLTYYKGNYDTFINGYGNYLRNLEKEYIKIQKRIKEMKKKSVPKKEDKELLQKSLTSKLQQISCCLQKPYRVKFFNNYELDNLSPPIIQVKGLNFGYTEDKLILYDIYLDITMGTRLAIVGKNGIGKSTLMKILLGEIKIDNKDAEEIIYMNNRLRISYYHQHSSDILPLDKTPIEYVHELDPKLEQQEIRKYLGSIGLEGKLHNKPMKIFSGGQKARVVFVTLYLNKPHIIFLDEPTNHLDIETINALIESINNFEGGVVMITHNIDLIERTDCELLELEDKKLYKTDIEEYQQDILEEIYGNDNDGSAI